MLKSVVKSDKGRRSYTKLFKAELVAQYLSGDESVASIALDHGLNANLLHRWITEYRRHGMHDLTQLEDNNTSQITSGNWLSILPTPQSVPAVQSKRAVRLNNSTPKDKPKTEPQTINISVTSDSLSLDLQWPNTDHTGLAKFIKELMA